ncbi:hypothetical protein ACFL6U_08995 [Planctomycetota bacterium]
MVQKWVTIGKVKDFESVNGNIKRNQEMKHLSFLPGVIKGEFRKRGMYGMEPPGLEWITLYRPGYLGKTKQSEDNKREHQYGCDNWRTAFAWGNQVITYNTALQLYEDGYLEHFKRHPDILEWLLSTAANVYDNSDSNILSGVDYSIQETNSTHLQDIAIRRCVLRLGREFTGDHLVEIRDHESEGFRLNPGQIPFHIPEMIVQPEPKGWWKLGSIESFWQSNKVFQVRERTFSSRASLTIHLFAINPNDNMLVELRNGRPIGLPTICYNSERNFESVMNDQLIKYGLCLKNLNPTPIEPVFSEGFLNVIFEVSVTVKETREHDFVRIEQARSNIRNNVTRKLLKAAFK